MDGNVMDDVHRDFVMQTVTMIDEGRYSDALARAEARLQEHRDDSHAHLVAAVAQMRMGNLDAAGEMHRAADVTLEMNAPLYDRLGDAYRDGERPNAALPCYRKALSLDPDGDDAAARAQKIIDLTGDAEEVITDETRIASNFYTLTLAELYEKQGHQQQAEEVYREIVNRDPENQEAKRRLTALTTGGNTLVYELEQWLYRLHQSYSYE